jgi:mannose-6-phosphate isomerase-like protein (cupin superfamily)
VEAAPGDIVSFPIHAFRGFENIGEEAGFLWSVLGGDDPGRVLWAPKVFEMAKTYGLILLENGALVDTTIGQSPPPDIKPMPVTGADAIARLRKIRPEEISEVMSRAPRQPRVGEELVIGPGGNLPPADGFSVSRLILKDGEASAETTASHPEVLFVQNGGAKIRTTDAEISLGQGDTMTIPMGLARSYCALAEGAELIIVRGTG